VTVKNHFGKEVPLILDPENPITIGPLDLYDFYFEHKMQQIDAMGKAPKVIEEIGKEYGELSGRTYGLVHPYKLEDAEIAIVGLGSTMGTAKIVVDKLREKGVKAGLLRVRAFRPFPVRQIVENLKDKKAIGVLDRAASFGAYGGPLFNEVRNVFYDQDIRPLISNYIYGLGGRDMPPQRLMTIFEDLQKIAETRRIEKTVKYIGVRG